MLFGVLLMSAVGFASVKSELALPTKDYLAQLPKKLVQGTTALDVQDSDTEFEEMSEACKETMQKFEQAVQTGDCMAMFLDMFAAESKQDKTLCPDADAAKACAADMFTAYVDVMDSKCDESGDEEKMRITPYDETDMDMEETYCDTLETLQDEMINKVMGHKGISSKCITDIKELSDTFIAKCSTVATKLSEAKTAAECPTKEAAEECATVTKQVKDKVKDCKMDEIVEVSLDPSEDDMGYEEEGYGDSPDSEVTEAQSEEHDVERDHSYPAQQIGQDQTTPDTSTTTTEPTDALESGDNPTPPGTLNSETPAAPTNSVLSNAACKDVTDSFNLIMNEGFSGYKSALSMVAMVAAGLTFFI